MFVALGRLPLCHQSLPLSRTYQPRAYFAGDDVGYTGAGVVMIAIDARHTGRSTTCVQNLARSSELAIQPPYGSMRDVHVVGILAELPDIHGFGGLVLLQCIAGNREKTPSRHSAQRQHDQRTNCRLAM
jgi:hypothetical protein